MQRFWTVVLGLIMLSSPAILAQTGRATLTGNVYDPSGASVSNAKVTITDIRQGISQLAKTNSAGAYTIPELNPGSYEVKVEADGFKTEIRSKIKLEVEQTARQNFTLELGGVTQSVKVNGTSVLLHTDDSTVGQVIPNRDVVELPLIGRNYLQLSLLTVGVAPASGSRAQGTGAFSALGQHGYQMRVILDGVDNSPTSSGGELGYASQMVTPSVDAVQEFKVVTDNNSAEYGFRMGGTVIVSTKSGTNGFHGDIYEFLRNDKLDAANYFSGGHAVPPYHRNEFGGTLGGPIHRNKTFFFVSYDGVRTSERNPAISTLPLPAELKGDFSGQPTIYDPTTTTKIGSRTAFINNIIPTGRIDPVAENLVSLFPAPNLPRIANNFYYDSPSTNTPEEVDSRVDQSFSERYRAYVRYSHRWDNSTTGGPLPLPADGSAWTNLALSANSAVADFNATISPNIYNDLVASYSNLNTLLGIPATQNENAQYGIKGLNDFGSYNQTGLSAILFSGFASLGSHLANPSQNSMGVVQLADKLLIAHGHHSIATGFSFLGEKISRLTSKNSRGQLIFTGAYTEDTSSRATTGSPIADFLLGDIQKTNVSDLAGETVTALNYSAYVQDNWHVAPSLTVNLGIRWDLLARPSYGHSKVDIFTFTPGSQVYNITYPKGTGDCGCDQDWKTFAPRVGFSYLAKPGTVVRSGFGIVYGEPDALQPDAGGFFNQAPFFDDFSFIGNELNEPAGTLANGFPIINYNTGIVPAKVSVAIADHYQPTQYAMQWFADVEQQLGEKSTFTLSYLGSGTRHLVIATDQNQPQPGPGSIFDREPHPKFVHINLNDPVGNASYNALTAKIDRIFSNGIMLLGSYTWSHAIDNDVENLNSTPGEGIQNNYNLQAERGNSIFDIRQYFVTSAVYDLPFGKGRRFLNQKGWVSYLLGGWQLAGILTLHSGSPFTPYLSTDIAQTGTTNRPNRIGNGTLPESQRSIHRWFNVSDFPVQPNYTFGDSGRNILAGPGTRNLDLNIVRVFPFVHNSQLEFRSEFYNALNTPNFGLPDGEVDLPQAGQITTASPAREIQFALKLLF